VGFPAKKLTEHPGVRIHQRAVRYDPTRTTTLRNAFVRDMNVRFTQLKRVIRKAIVDEDCFGLMPLPPGVTRIVVQAALTTPGPSAFDFPRSADKVAAFMAWLNGQVEAPILEITEMPRIGGAIEAAWTDVYIKDSYSRGITRARYEMGSAGYHIPSMSATGGIHASLVQPPHADRLGLLYTRTYSGLKGITADMDTKISRILSQGIADGDHPKVLSRKLLATIDGAGAGTLGITDSLGRFIPPQRRARMLARTEIIRAHAQAQLQEMQNWAVVGVTAEVEFSTAGYGVCPICVDLKGKVYSIKEAWNIIPVHPNCRCQWLPKPVEKGEAGLVPEEVPVAPIEEVPEEIIRRPEGRPEYVPGTPLPPLRPPGVPLPPDYAVGQVVIEDIGLEEWKPLFGSKKTAERYVTGSKVRRDLYFSVDEGANAARARLGTPRIDFLEGESRKPGYSSGYRLVKDKPEAATGRVVGTAKVRLENPYVYNWDGSTRTALTSRGGPLGAELRSLLEAEPTLNRHEAVRRILLSQGYDGIVISKEGVIVFNPDNVAVFKMEKYKPPRVVQRPVGPAVEVELTKAQSDAVMATKVKGALSDPVWAKFGDRKEMMMKAHARLVKDIETGEAEMWIRRKFNKARESFKDCLETGQMKNQFVTRTTSGSRSAYKGGGRDGWEKTCFDGAYQKNPQYRALKSGDYLPTDLGMERPIYGYMNPGSGYDGARQYGDVIMIMKPETCAGRVTFTIGNSSSAYGTGQDTGFFGHQCNGILSSLARHNRTIDFLKYSEGDLPLTALDCTVNRGYIELQFHGGIDFRRDVAKIVVEGSKSGYGHVQELADKFGIPIEYRPRY